ncbi:MAG: FG-GAP repeat protein [Rhizomicrobium sp.]
MFTRTGTTWSRQAYVKASNPTVNAGFGVSIALLGDTLAVGAYGARSDIMNMAIAEGGAYVFARAGTAWSQQAFVRPAQPQPGATFGRSVALAENTLVVGSDNESGSSKGIDGDQAAQSAGQAGAAFVFTRTGTSWSQRHYLKATNPRADARFGISVATSKDTVVVGSLAESSKAMA